MPKERKTEQLAVRVTPTMRGAVVKAAADSDLDVSEWMVGAIEKSLKEGKV